MPAAAAEVGYRGQAMERPSSATGDERVVRRCGPISHTVRRCPERHAQPRHLTNGYGEAARSQIVVGLVKSSTSRNSHRMRSVQDCQCTESMWTDPILRRTLQRNQRSGRRQRETSRSLAREAPMENHRPRAGRCVSTVRPANLGRTLNVERSVGGRREPRHDLCRERSATAPLGVTLTSLPATDTAVTPARVCDADRMARPRTLKRGSLKRVSLGCVAYSTGCCRPGERMPVPSAIPKRMKRILRTSMECPRRVSGGDGQPESSLIVRRAPSMASEVV